jgi:N-carbamoyl-L-amino-acid hydrolase
MNLRRTLLMSCASAALVLTLAPVGPHGAAAAINAERLKDHLVGLSAFGRNPEGGVSRVAFSDADLAGRAYVLRLMAEAGLSPHVDAAGNLVGRLHGSDANAPAILIGSHIDSVPHGGNFDGDVGSMGAIEVVQTLRDEGAKLRHPLEVAIWANEEGDAYGRGLYGSRAAIGGLAVGELDEVENGVKLTDAIRKIGGDPSRLGEPIYTSRNVRAYVELHIEQGGTLDAAGIPVGVVEGIVGIDHYLTIEEGFANHAGTTPMANRQDALVAAAQVILAVRDIVRAEPGRQVGTVGELHVMPNAPNVIPGQVRHIIELRDLSNAKIEQLAERIRARVREIATATGTTISMTRRDHIEAALAAPDLQALIEQSASELRLKTMRLPSGAGHDAQTLARIAPMAMIFVPSVSGISHSPKELSRWDDIANGAEVLRRVVLRIDQMNP